MDARCVSQGMLFVFPILVFAIELLFHACTACFARNVVSICMFGYTGMFFGGVERDPVLRGTRIRVT